MPRPIAFNLVRTVLGAANGVPRGIDHIDFGYLSHLFDHWPADCFGVLPTPWGVRIFDRERVVRARDVLARIWNEHDPRGEDPALVRLRAAWVSGPAEAVVPARRRSVFGEIPEYLRVLRLILAGGPRLGRSVAALPAGTLHLDVGHHGLSRPASSAWLGRRPDIAPVFMIHDVIPMQFPELATAHRVADHGRVMDTTARWARAVLTSTRAAAAGIREELARRGRPDVPIHAVALPVEDVFDRSVTPDPVLAARPYFIVCGAVVPRKNHAILIEAWSRLAARHGAGTPRLLIAGASDHPIATTLRDEVVRRGLADHIVFASGLSTPSIARAMAGARGLLMPSLAEGFGLPPVEAMAVGTPAVVSDIPAHRDATGDVALRAGTGAVDDWVAAVDLLTGDTAERAEIVRRVRARPRVDWRGYMAEIGAILARVD